MFASYEAELDAVSEALRGSLAAVEAGGDGGDPRERRNALQKCEVDLAQLDSLLRQMNVEVRSDPKPGSKRKLGEHREAVRAMRQKVETLKQQSERHDLFEARDGATAQRGDGYAGLSKAAQEDRSRLEQVTARMDRSTEALLDSRRTLAETEDVAMSISENLSANRSLIIGAHERVTATGGLLGGASQILRRMRQRETRRKMMLGLLIFLLIFVIIIIFAFALRPATAPTLRPTAEPTTAATIP